MKKSVKIITALVSVILALSFFSCSADDDDKSSPPATLTSKKTSIIVPAEIPSMMNKTRDTDYDVSVAIDGEVFDDATVFDKSLAMASFLSAMESRTESRFNELCESIGFDNIKTSYETSDDINSVSFGFAHRKINGSDVILCGCEGVRYTVQWGGNLTIGAAGDHEGFLKAATTVYTALKKYIDDNYKSAYEAKTLKLWLTGYSRAGAITNVLSYLILGDDDKKLAIEQKNVFAYTFSAPKGLSAEHATEFPNVFNLVSEADPVTYLAPEEYGFYRCGIDKVLFESKEENYIKHTKTERTPLSTRTLVKETYSYTTKIDDYVKELDSELSLPEFWIHESTWYEYEDGTTTAPSESTANYTTEKEMVAWLLRLLMEKGGDATGGYSFNTRELYADTLQEHISYALQLFFQNREAFDSLTAEVKASPLMSISKWMYSDDGLYTDVKKCLDAAGATYDDVKLNAVCTAILKMIDIGNGEGCLSNLVVTILPMAVGGNKDFVRLIDMHFPEVQYVLIKNM